MNIPENDPHPATHSTRIPLDEMIERTLDEALNNPSPPPRYPLSTVGIAVILTIFGLALIFQSDRWSNTPSYGNLLILLPADAWGGVYLVGAALMIAGLAWQVRWLGLAAHAVAFMLLLGWEFAFGVRWLTDDGTTIANVVAWGTYVAILLVSVRLFNARTTVA